MALAFGCIVHARWARCDVRLACQIRTTALILVDSTRLLEGLTLLACVHLVVRLRPTIITTAALDGGGGTGLTRLLAMPSRVLLVNTYSGTPGLWVINTCIGEVTNVTGTALGGVFISGANLLGCNTLTWRGQAVTVASNAVVINTLSTSAICSTFVLACLS